MNNWEILDNSSKKEAEHIILKTLKLTKERVQLNLEWIRITPFGFSIWLLNLIAPILFFQESLRKEVIPLFEYIIVLSMLTSWTIASIKKIQMQFELKNRLETIISEDWYSDRKFYHTLRKWCSRQTASVILRKYWHLEEYKKLCKENNHKFSFITKLPTI